MATVATQIVPQQVTVTATNAAIARGLRVSRSNAGLVAVAGATERGDYITTQAIAASGRGLGAPIAVGGSIPVVPNEIVADGDLVYSAADGKVSKTSTNTFLVGKMKQAAAANTLAVCELKSVA